MTFGLSEVKVSDKSIIFSFIDNNWLLKEVMVEPGQGWREGRWVSGVESHKMSICWGNNWQSSHTKNRTHQRSQRRSWPQNFRHSRWMRKSWWLAEDTQVLTFHGFWPAETTPITDNLPEKPMMLQQCPSWETAAFSGSLQRLCPWWTVSRCIVGYTDPQSICLAFQF